MQRIKVVLAIAAFCALAGLAAADATDTTYAGIETPVGTNVVITFGPNVILTFEEVTQAGTTSLQIISDFPPIINFIPLPLSAPARYAFQTTAVYDGVIDICLGYSDDGLTPSEEELLYIVRNSLEYDWYGSPAQVDAANNIACYHTISYFDWPVVVALPGGICGDANANGVVDVGDIVYLVQGVFKCGPAPNPDCIGDPNGDGWYNIGDAVFLINYIFKKGLAPAEDCCDAPVVVDRISKCN